MGHSEQTGTTNRSYRSKRSTTPHDTSAVLPPLTRAISPKEFAQVIGVSESSVKRWVDDGLIEVSRTAGGHRRIFVGDAIRFIRSRGIRIVRPDVLGLPDQLAAPHIAHEEELSGEVLLGMLLRGERQTVIASLVRDYLSGRTLAALFDGPVAMALERIGEIWRHDEEGIYFEHVATNICIEAIAQLQGLAAPSAEIAPIAVGSAGPADPYIIPSMMVSAVLSENGFSTVNLGARTPLKTLERAAVSNRANLVWMAITSHPEEHQIEVFSTTAQRIADTTGAKIVIGGRGAFSMYDAWPTSIRLLSNMQEMVHILRQR
jgi:MerR family transcriptional regulator, light-induced transcriptional regulator